ncbi:mucin-5AC-like, partial [Palaemon carinicauda]|uniref:mucin-5AC-like n=1 Tax=Palaemon carinicauda TaxID=392227 RepID=UPI0035B59EB1
FFQVICVAATVVTAHPVEVTYSTPDLTALRSESAETPGHADDAFQFAYAVASPEHGTYHGHQARRDQQGQTSGSYYALGSDGHWRQTIYADKGKGFLALSDQRPAGSPPPQFSEVNYQIFVHPGATAISASGSRPPAEISFFRAKGAGRALPSLGFGNFFDDDSDEDDSDDDDDDSFSLESDYDNFDVDDDVFRQNFNFNFRHENNDEENDNEENDNEENDNEENENDETENDEDDDENNSLFPNLPTPATVPSFPSHISTHVSPSAPGLPRQPSSSSVRTPSFPPASPEEDEDASVLLSNGNNSNENEFPQPSQPAIGTVSHISPVFNAVGSTALVTGQIPDFVPAATPVSLHNPVFASVPAHTSLRIPAISRAPAPAPIDTPGFAPVPTSAPRDTPDFAPVPTPAPRDTPGFTPVPTPAPRDIPGFAPVPTPPPRDTPGFAPVPTPAPRDTPGLTPAPTPAPFLISGSTAGPGPTPTPIPIPASAPTTTSSTLRFSASARTPEPLDIPTFDQFTTPSPLHFPNFAPSITDPSTNHHNVGIAFQTTPTPIFQFSPTQSSVDPSVLAFGNSAFIRTPFPALFNSQSSNLLSTNDINTAPSPFANAFSVSTPSSIQPTFGSFAPLSGSTISSRQQSTSPVVNPTLQLGSPAVFPFAIVPTSALSVASSPVNTASQQRTQTILQSLIQAPLQSNNLQQSFNIPITEPFTIRAQSSLPLSHTSVLESQFPTGFPSLRTLNRPASLPVTRGSRVSGQISGITQASIPVTGGLRISEQNSRNAQARIPVTGQNSRITQVSIPVTRQNSRITQASIPFAGGSRISEQNSRITQASIPVTSGSRVTGQNSRITQSALSAFIQSSAPSAESTRTATPAHATVQTRNPFPVNFQTPNRQINFSALRGAGIPLSFTSSQLSLGAPVQPSRFDHFLDRNILNHSGETSSHSVNRSGVVDDTSAVGIPLF